MLQTTQLLLLPREEQHQRAVCWAKAARYTRVHSCTVASVIQLRVLVEKVHLSSRPPQKQENSFALGAWNNHFNPVACLREFVFT